MNRTIHTALKRTLSIVALMAMTLCAWADGVAKIGDTEYATLQAAVKAAEANSTIVLTTDITETVANTTNANSFTIDLGNHTWTYTKKDNDYAALKQDKEGSVITLKNGTITTTTTEGFNVWARTGKVIIESGTYNVNTHEDYNVYTTGGYVDIKGGTFTNSDNTAYNHNASLHNLNLNVHNTASSIDHIKVYGGTFTADPSKGDDAAWGTSTFVAEGYVVQQNSDGTFSVGTPVAQIDETKYISLQAAVNAATEGQTIVLISDISEVATNADNAKNFTIDLNGKTWSHEAETTDDGWAAFRQKSTGTITIKNGSIVTKVAFNIWASNGKVIIENGNYTCNTNDNYNVYVNADGVVEIQGGSFINLNTDPYLYNSSLSSLNLNLANGTSTNHIQVSGGTFTADPAMGDDSNWGEAGSSFLTSGNYSFHNADGTYTIKDQLDMTDDTDFSKISRVNEGITVNTVKYTRITGMVGVGSTTGTKYGTICLPFSIKEQPTDMTLYKATSISGSTLTITSVDYPIAAGTPLIFELTSAATSMTVASTDATVNTTAPSTSTTDGNILIGTFEAKTIDSDLGSIYYLNGDKFHQAQTSLVVPIYRAYLKTQSSGAKPRMISIAKGDEDATGISNINTLDSATEIFDLNGRKQNGLQRGVNIMRRADGSTIKVLVK